MLLRLVREYDVLLESFRPGVMERLGVGYETLREANPRLVYCAITGYGQDGPYTGRSGHDMNYLGLNGLLGLSGDADGPPVQPAGQIADLGGGALMAAFGILAALRERERSGEGQLVDVSMFDGSLSWLALVAAKYLADGAPPGRGELELAGGLICYRPYACRDGWVTLGALEPKFWQEWCRGVGPRGPGREAVRAARLGGARGGRAHLHGAHARRVAGVRIRARLLPRAGARPRRGARLGARAGARDGGGAGAAGGGSGGAPARRAGEALAHARRSGGTRVPRSASTRPRCSSSLGYSDEEIAALLEAGSAAGPAHGPQGSFLA